MRINKLKKIGLSMLFLIILIFLFKYNFDRIRREKNSLYTLAKVTDYSIPGKTGYQLIYKFKSNGVTYEGGEPIANNPLSYIGRHFYVQFYAKRPQNCKLLLEIYVSDTTIELPQIGWRSVPELNQ